MRGGGEQWDVVHGTSLKMWDFSRHSHLTSVGPGLLIRIRSETHHFGWPFLSGSYLLNSDFHTQNFELYRYKKLIFYFFYVILILSTWFSSIEIENVNIDK